MDITRMAIKLLFGHGSEDGLDNCRIDVIHDLLEKRGNVEQHRLVIWRSERLRSFLIWDFFCDCLPVVMEIAVVSCFKK